jgi:hypothetical protein
MRRLISLLGSCALLLGCAAQGPPSPQTAVSSPQKTAAAQPAATQAVSAPSSAEAAPATASAGPPPGWKVKTRRSGAIYYCKVVEVTGSLFPQEVCLPPKELERVLEAQKVEAQRTLDIPRTRGSQ